MSLQHTRELTTPKPLLSAETRQVANDQCQQSCEGLTENQRSHPKTNSAHTPAWSSMIDTGEPPPPKATLAAEARTSGRGYGPDLNEPMVRALHCVN